MTLRLSVCLVVLALALAQGGGGLAQSDVTACGGLIAFEAPTAARLVGEVQLNSGGRLVSYKVRGPGTISPPNIAAIGTALRPVTAQFSGALGSDGVVTGYALTQVTACPTTSLPNTSTDGVAASVSPIRSAESVAAAPSPSRITDGLAAALFIGVALSLIALLSLLPRGRRDAQRLADF